MGNLLDALNANPLENCKTVNEILALIRERLVNQVNHEDMGPLSNGQRAALIFSVEALTTPLPDGVGDLNLLDAYDACHGLVQTIDVTGGLCTNDDGDLAPLGDDTWSDLVEPYFAACAAIGTTPRCPE